MKPLVVGVAPQEQIRQRVLAIARGDLKPKPGDPKVWFTNDWAIETMHNPKYPLELFQRVVTVSLETQKIVAALPALTIREGG